MKTGWIIVSILTFLASPLIGSEVSSKKVGPDKAVTSADESIGFRLRGGVEERFGIVVQAIREGNPILPRSALVYTKGEVEVFRRRDGYWKAVAIRYQKRGARVEIIPGSLRAGDELAVEGGSLLKVIELDIFAAEEAGHIH